MTTTQEDRGRSLLSDVANHKKEKFIKLVEHFARLRDVQYDNDNAESIIRRAKKTVAENLPSNLLRAAAIFVDWSHGFPPDGGSFGQPKWATATDLLPEEERGSLVCERFKSLSDLEIDSVAVLLADFAKDGLHAGMAGIVRDIIEEDECVTAYTVEFGEPQECVTVIIDVPKGLLRTPRPGDLIENYRR